MFKAVATYFATKFLTPAELLKLGTISEKLTVQEGMEAATALVDRHQYRWAFERQETFANKVIGILVRRTCLGTTFAYFRGRFMNSATREESLIVAGERLVMDALEASDRVDTLSYPALFADFVTKAIVSEERNVIKRRAALVKEIKVELGEIPSDVAGLIAGLAEEVAKAHAAQ